MIECEKAAYVSCFELAVGYVAVEILADAINFSAGIRACKKLDIKSFSRMGDYWNLQLADPKNL